MISFTDLTKRYSETLALDRLTLQIPEGAVFGLLGPNGAGKTTLLRLAMGFVFPDEGQIDRGHLLPAHIGYLPERAFYPPRFSIGDYLLTIGRLAGLRGSDLKRTVDQLLDQLGLAEIPHRRVGACSRGMLQRLGVGQALLGNPRLVLLDEPVLGLDPAAQKWMRDQIVALHQEGKSIVLSSHHLDEVTRVCTHVAVINKGRLVRSGPLEAMLAPRPQVTISTGALPSGLPARLEALVPAISISAQQITLSGDAIAHKDQVLRLLLDEGVNIRQLHEQHASLEEIYLEATSP